MKSGKQLVAEYGFAQFYAIAVSVITLPLTARVLGPEGRGVIAAAIAWGGLIGGIASLSLGHALQHRLQSRASADLATHFGTLVAAALGLGGVAAAIVVIAAHFSETTAFGQLPREVVWLLALFLPVFVWDQFYVPLSGLAHTLSPLSRWQVAFRTVVAASLFGLAGLTLLSPLTALGALWIGHLLIGAAAAFFVWRTADGMRADVQELRAILPTALMLHVATVGALVLETGSVLLINAHLSKEDVGIYQLAQQMITFLQIVPQSIAVILTAHISRSTPDEYWPRQRAIVLKAAAAMFGLAVVAYLLAPILVHLLAGPRFHDSVHLFRALLPSLAGLTLAQLLVPQWISRGILGLHALVSIGMAVMMLVGTWYAIDLWGVKGAAYARVAIFGGVMVVTQLCFMLWIERRWRRTRSAT